MTLLYSLASTTLITTSVILLLLAFTPLLDRKFAAAGRCWLWLLVMAGLCAPFISFIPRPMLQIDVPLTEAVLNAPSQDVYTILSPDTQTDSNIVPISNDGDITANEPSSPVSSSALPESRTFHFPILSLADVVLLLWLAGILVSAVYHTFAYMRFRRFVRRWSAAVTEDDVVTAFHEECAHMGVRGGIRLLYCKGIQAPMLTGFIRPVVLMPNTCCSMEDIPFMIRHELAHYKRCDLWYKLALVTVRCVYWFNPAIHLMASQANKDIETACDVKTVSGMDMAQRKQYSEIILSMAVGPRLCRSQLTTCFTGGKNMLKQRFSNILGAAKKNGAAVFTVIGVVVVTTGLLVGCNFSPKTSELSDRIEDAPSLSQIAQDFQDVGVNYDNSDTLNENMGDFTDDYIYIDGWENDAVIYDNLDELKALVYDEAKPSERQFEDVTALELGTVNEDIRITRGGDKLILRYSEWLDDEYTLTTMDGGKTVRLERRRETRYLKIGNSTSTNDWLYKILQERGDSTERIVEIIVPEFIPLDGITIDSVSGAIDIDGIELERLEVDVVSSSAHITDCIVGTISLDSVSGFNQISGCVFNELSVDTVSGDSDIQLTDKAENYDISHTTVSGSLEINGERVKNARNTSASKRIELGDVSGSFSVTDGN